MYIFQESVLQANISKKKFLRKNTLLFVPKNVFYEVPKRY
ncbi:hypothetical protein ES703_46553 [subsurface metagenome]